MEYLFCLNRCFGFNSTNLTHFEQTFNEICLDGTNIGNYLLFIYIFFNHFFFCPLSTGNDVVIIKRGKRICGKGGAITNYPIVQNKAYFEAKIQQLGDILRNSLSNYL